jgi:hypothetical protein
MATIETAARKAFGLDDSGWQRHTNPWSVYTRIPIPALLALAIWSRDRHGLALPRHERLRGTR